MNNKLVYAKDLKPGMVLIKSGYTEIILTVTPDLIDFIGLKFLRPDGTVRRCSYPIYSLVTIYDPS